MTMGHAVRTEPWGRSSRAFSHQMVSAPHPISQTPDSRYLTASVRQSRPLSAWRNWSVEHVAVNERPREEASRKPNLVR